MENNIKKILRSFVAYCIVCNGHSLTFDFHITSCTQCESVCNTSKRENYALYSKIFRRKERRYSLLRQHFGTEQSRRLKSTRHRRLYRSFTSLNTNLQVGNFPAGGTTLDYASNGSFANLNLPADSTILRAELVWGGLYRSSTNNISNLLNSSITFTTPQGQFSVLPDPATAQTFDIPAAGNDACRRLYNDRRRCICWNFACHNTEH